jgi:hypothetical protein
MKKVISNIHFILFVLGMLFMFRVTYELGKLVLGGL